MQERMTRAYGTNPAFKGGPKKMSPNIHRELTESKTEHIFGVVEEHGHFGSTKVMRVLPRDEPVKIDGEYYEARHTHSEFGNPNTAGREVQGAGTVKEEKFNFRTGHYVVEGADLKTKQDLRYEVQEAVQFSRDKTLPSRYSHFKHHALDYEKG